MDRTKISTVAKYLAMREEKKKLIMEKFYKDIKDNKTNAYSMLYGPQKFLIGCK